MIPYSENKIYIISKEKANLIKRQKHGKMRILFDRKKTGRKPWLQVINV